MSRLIFALAVAAFAVLGTNSRAEDTYTPGKPVSGNFEDFAQGFLDKNCLECHDDISTEGDLNLLDLGPVDEAEAYRNLLNSYGATQEELAEMLGKKRSSVTNTLRILTAAGEAPSDIDVERAQQAETRARKRLKPRRDDMTAEEAQVDIARASAALRRAIMRLKVHGYGSRAGH